MSDERPPWSDATYTRVYHSAPERMGAEWFDDAFLAAWLRLLVLADRIYPTPPPLPRWLDDAVLARLVAAELIRLESPETYTVAGLAKERNGHRLGRRAGGLARAAQAASDGRGPRGRFVTSNPPATSDAGDQQRTSNAPATTSIAPATPPASPANTDTNTDTDTYEEVPIARVTSNGRRRDPWQGWDPAWASFRVAWQERGFRRPPSEKQREALWDAVDHWPRECGSWVSEAPAGAKARDVVGHVLKRWHERQAAGNRKADEAARWRRLAEDPSQSAAMRAEARRALEAIQRHVDGAR